MVRKIIKYSIDSTVIGTSLYDDDYTLTEQKN